MLIKKDMSDMVDGQTIETVALIKSYAVRPTKNKTLYMDGVLEMKGSVSFKVWSGNLFDEMKKCDYQNVICHITGKVNEFNGSKSIVLISARAVQEGAYNASDFFEEKYKIEDYWKALENIVVKNCSSEITKVYQTIMSGVEDRFKYEFAARGHHDATRGGLLAHTYKVTYIMARVVRLYSSILKVVDNDLLILGCALHDIGKVMEYTNGSIQGVGLIVSHHTFGVEILLKYKEDIISAKGEEFFYRLLAIIEQHHGEYEETPRTIEAYLVHMADNLESTFQSINETFEQDISMVSIDGFKLN